MNLEDRETMPKYLVMTNLKRSMQNLAAQAEYGTVLENPEAYIDQVIIVGF